MDALDLRTQPPRSCYDELGGLIFFSRTIDKIRGMLPGGHPGVYFIDGPIQGISGYLLQQLGITEEQLKAAVARFDTEDEIVRWLHENTDRSKYDRLNGGLRGLRRKHLEHPDVFASIYAPTLEQHPELDHILDIIEADDRRMFQMKT